jgi:hypothetical protein
MGNHWIVNNAQYGSMNAKLSDIEEDCEFILIPLPLGSNNWKLIVRDGKLKKILIPPTGGGRTICKITTLASTCCGLSVLAFQWCFSVDDFVENKRYRNIS